MCVKRKVCHWKSLRLQKFPLLDWTTLYYDLFSFGCLEICLYRRVFFILFCSSVFNVHPWMALRILIQSNRTSPTNGGKISSSSSRRGRKRVRDKQITVSGYLQVLFWDGAFFVAIFLLWKHHFFLFNLEHWLEKSLMQKIIFLNKNWVSHFPDPFSRFLMG